MVISTVGETIDAQMRQEFRDAGIFIATDTAMTMRALAWLYRRQRLFARENAPHRSPLPTRAPPRGWSETMDYLEASGIRPVYWRVLGPDDRAAAACSALVYPLVVKVLPSESEHKTELGLVKLRVQTPAEVDAHAADFRRRLGKPEMGVLVQEMVDGGVEVVLSCLRNTDFGPIISIGMGGIAIELFRDVTHLALRSPRLRCYRHCKSSSSGRCCRVSVANSPPMSKRLPTRPRASAICSWRRRP